MDFAWFSGTEIRNKVENNKTYQEAIKFAQTYEPKADRNYDWVIAHSIEEYKGLEHAVEALDSKADGLLKYLGAGTVIVTLAISSSNFGTWASAWQMVPCVTFLGLAVFFAARARAPEKTPTPLHTNKAFGFADTYEPAEAKASFAAMTGAASIGLTLVISEKAKLIRKAYWWFVLAITWAIAVSAILGVSKLVSS